jgi:hypothetical protein
MVDKRPGADRDAAHFPIQKAGIAMDLTPWADLWRLFVNPALPRRASTTLQLPLPMTRDRAYELTETIPIRAKLQPFWMTTNGRRRGPYYKASFKVRGRSYSVHLGTEDAKRELEAAHALVRAELEAEAAEVAPSVGDMIDRHRRLYGDDATPLANLKRSAPARAANAPGARLETTEAAKLREVAR